VLNVEEIRPTAVYSKRHLAAMLEVATKTVERQWQEGELPTPFYQGRHPCWTGQALIDFFRMKQERALLTACA
jgi:hypothetical protein